MNRLLCQLNISNQGEKNALRKSLNYQPNFKNLCREFILRWIIPNQQPNISLAFVDSLTFSFFTTKRKKKTFSFKPCLPKKKKIKIKRERGEKQTFIRHSFYICFILWMNWRWTHVTQQSWQEVDVRKCFSNSAFSP